MQRSHKEGAGESSSTTPALPRLHAGTHSTVMASIRSFAGIPGGMTARQNASNHSPRFRQLLRPRRSLRRRYDVRRGRLQVEYQLRFFILQLAHHVGNFLLQRPLALTVVRPFRAAPLMRS